MLYTKLITNTLQSDKKSLLPLKVEQEKIHENTILLIQAIYWCYTAISESIDQGFPASDDPTYYSKSIQDSFTALK